LLAPEIKWRNWNASAVIWL